MSETTRLTADWTIDADRVAVKYRFSNAGPDPVYVIDGSFHAKAMEIVWSDRLKVGFRPPETVVVGSRLTPLDPRTHYAIPPHTFAVKVAAGATHESTLTALMPLVADGTTTEPVPEAVVIGGKIIPPPFDFGPPPLADRRVVCRVVVLELGVIPHDEKLRAQPANLAGRDLFRLEKAAWSLQQIVTVEKRPVELPILVPAAWLPER